MRQGDAREAQVALRTFRGVEWSEEIDPSTFKDNPSQLRGLFRPVSFFVSIHFSIFNGEKQIR